MAPDEQPPPMATPRVAAGALFTDEDGNVLLVKPTYKEGWDIPGGYVEPCETPTEACAREIKEELGLDFTPGQLLVIDWAPSPREGDKILFVFDGGVITRGDEAQFSLPDDELHTFAFQPVDAFDELMPQRLAQRLRAACTITDGTTVYLEHGRPRDDASGTQVPRPPR